MAEKEYTHIMFQFNDMAKRGGKNPDVTAFLLVPPEAMEKFEAWQNAPWIEPKYEGCTRRQDRMLEYEMYRELIEGGAILHREDGPAYRVVNVPFRRDTDRYWDGQTIDLLAEEWWVKGEKLEMPIIKKLGTLKM